MIHKYIRKFVYWYLKKYEGIDSWKLQRIARLSKIEILYILRQMALDEHKEELVTVLLNKATVTYNKSTKVIVKPSSPQSS